MTISEMMEQGLPVSPQIASLNVERLEAWRKEYEEKGMIFMLPRIDDAIAAIESYRPGKRERIKPRKPKDIQANIDEAQKLVEGYRAARQYGLETEWKKNVAEYQREYMEALDGRIYVPVITHNDKSIGRVKRDG